MSEIVLGIDLGTTYSAAYVARNGRVEPVPSRRGGHLTPSMVGFLPDGERVVGQDALSLSLEIPENVAYATKRFIGRRWSPELAAAAREVVPYELVAGPAGDIRVKLGERTLPLSQVSATILGELKLDAEAYVGQPIHLAVITVPANFDDLQRQATKEAAHIAGLRVLRLINEPTAAALAYGLTNKFEGRALVFDLGGGTFDVSVLEVVNGEFEVIVTGGDPRLGGEDFDRVIAEWLLAQVPDPYRELAARDRLSMMRLRIISERAKRELTKTMEAQIEALDLGDTATGRVTDLYTALTRPFFETLAKPLTERCLELCDELMMEGNVSPSGMDAVLMVGGMSQVPVVRRLVREFYGREPAEGVDPNEAVAQGAALYGAALTAQTSYALLRDVTSHSLGVATVGGRVRRLIARNTPVPVRTNQVFLPSREDQREARIAIYEGEGDTVAENSLLGEIVLSGLLGGHRAENELQVSFDLAADGTLSVHATDSRTRTTSALEIRATTELPSAEVARLRREEAAHAQAESERRRQELNLRFTRALTRANELYPALQQAVRMLSTPEHEEFLARFAAVLEQAREAAKADDYPAKRLALEALPPLIKVVEPFLASL